MSIALGNTGMNLFEVLSVRKGGSKLGVKCEIVKEIKFRGERLAAVRSAIGWTQTELAHQIARRFPEAKVEPPQISAIESGIRRPSIDLAIAIAVVLETSLDYLTGIMEYDRGVNGHDEITVLARSEAQKTDVQTMVNPFMELPEKDRKLVIDLVMRLYSDGDDLVTINEKRFRRVIAALSDKLGGEVVADIASAYGVEI